MSPEEIEKYKLEMKILQEKKKEERKHEKEVQRELKKKEREKVRQNCLFFYEKLLIIKT